MIGVDFTDLTWKEIQAAAEADAALILPMAAIEACGPHLPVGTSQLVAGAVAARAVGRLRARGVDAYRLAPLAWTTASRSASFPGTLSIDPQTFRDLVIEIGCSLARMGFRRLGIATVHTDAAFLSTLAEAVGEVESRSGRRIAIPDLFDEKWADRLPSGFRGLTDHAGRLETSILLSLAPDLVRERVLRGLPAVSVLPLEPGRTLAGGGATEAYAGNPASATAEDGERFLATLGEIVAASILVPASPPATVKLPARLVPLVTANLEPPADSPPIDFEVDEAPEAPPHETPHATVFEWEEDESEAEAPAEEGGDDLAETILDGPDET